MSKTSRSERLVARSVQAGLAALVVVLPSFWSMIQLHSWWSPPLDAVVFAVMLGVALPRGLSRVSWGQVPVAILGYVGGAAVAVGVSIWLRNDDYWRIAGAVAFAVGAAVTVGLRLLGPLGQASGTLAQLGFIAILVHPLPVDATWAFLGWMLVAAGVAAVWALAVKALTAATASPVSLPQNRARTADPDTSRWSAFLHGLAPSTRMAVQLGVGLAVAFAAAEWLDPSHLVWPVLTVLIVHSGNRGRGDVLWKGSQRAVGALVGTAIATLLAGLFPAGDSRAVVVIFAILVLASAVRDFGYAYWAVGITAALAFMYGYFGESGGNLLTHRLFGVAVGVVVGIASAWFVLPVKTTDVVKLRIATLLGAAGEVAGSMAHGSTDADAVQHLAAADRELAFFDSTTEAARRLGIGSARRLSDAVAHAHALAGGLIDATGDAGNPSDYAELARQIGAARRSLSSGEAAPLLSESPLTTDAKAIADAFTEPQPVVG